MLANDIRNLILSRLPTATVTVESKDGKHYRAQIICSEFEGKSRIEQHQMVYAAIDSAIKSGTIHAISLKTSIK
ncbi:MAG: BolA/IbaG family iron-sulfur metabolism protein [Gammaproteobacteria bacterium]|nr:BolA/IbaG family iron-sulfur metabolism protein [Gammaproteobacteria bacterium]